MKTLSKIFLFLLTFAIAISSIRYLNFKTQGLLLNKSAELLSAQAYLVAFYTHVSFGIIALMLGPFQFMPKFRSKFLSLHRVLGKIYILACLLGGIAGFIIAQFADGGLISLLGFSLLAVAWLFTTFRAYKAVKEKKIIQHRFWMLRSFALTFAAVTLRLWMPILIILFKMNPESAYVLVSWLSWIPNLIFIEWLIIKRSGEVVVL